jgi:formylglycine-generating enzyme required for sulfatase activity
MTDEEPPVAFLSYTNSLDEHEGGRITRLRRRLEGEVRERTGNYKFRIFQDRIDIKWGQDWRRRITEALDEAMFLIPVITEGFFGSEPCRDELDCFIKREEKLGRKDLVLPLYYIDSDTMEKSEKRAGSRHAQAIHAHQYRDWLKLRNAPLASPKVKNQIAKLAQELKDALDRTSSIHIQSKGVISSPPTAPASANRSTESDQARKPERKTPAQADVPATAGETDTAGEPPEKLPGIADPHKQSLLKVTIPGGEVKSAQHAAARSLGIPVSFRDRLTIGTEGPEMLVIPSGHFRMGDISGKGDRSEQPVHAVILNRHFAIGRYTVTFDAYELFCDATRRSKLLDEGWGRGRQPVINVSWEDADAFCRWLSEQSGFLYRLPTEAEWEYAARGGTESAYWWGESFDARMAYCNSSRTAPTDSFEPNPFGLYQVHGNVWEWVQDVWHEDYKDAPDDGSPRYKWPTRIEKHEGSYNIMTDEAWSPIRRLSPSISWSPPQRSYVTQEEVEDRSAGHVLRGGSWKDQPFRLRSSARQSESKVNFSTVGLRVARDFD